MKDLVSFLQRMIQAKSLSGQEKEVAGVIEEELTKLGYSVSRDGTGNVIGELGDGKPEVLFEGHMDTVGVGKTSEWKYPPFSGRINEDCVYGRGAVDMKGSLASMVYAGADLQRELQSLEGKLTLAFVVHEETAEGEAIRRVLSERPAPDYVLLGEPSGLDLCIGHRGRAVFTLRTHGKIAHASMPEAGRNAVYDLMDVVGDLRSEDLPQDELLGKETMALVGISCRPGEGPVVPDEAQAQLDFRIIQGTAREDLVGLLEGLGTARGVDFDVSLHGKELTCYTGETIEASYFFPAWKETDSGFINVASQALDFIPRRTTRSWRFSTDGVATAGYFGLPTVGFGPGKEELAHQANERIAIERLKTARRGYRRIAEGLLRTSP